jgi:16S rRNA (uracil1498-N3)-methyltransferase
MKYIWVDEPKEIIELSGIEHNHIANVLRMRVGDEVTVISGDEFDRYYRIENITKKQSLMRFVSKSKNKCNPSKNFTVYLAVIKPDNLSIAVQKLNEIGATELKLFLSKFTVIKKVNTARLNEIARQSCKQCGRSIPLSVSFIGGFNNLITEVSAVVRQRVFFADENLAGENTPVKGTPELLVVGCEGGFDESERRELTKIATPISLGQRVLRAETACIVGAAKWCI